MVFVVNYANLPHSMSITATASASAATPAEVLPGGGEAVHLHRPGRLLVGFAAYHLAPIAS
jgi:hypothetical protein